MPIGVIVDCAAVLAGALAGCLAGGLIPKGMRSELNTLLGFCSMAIGINSIIKVSAMAPVVFAVLIGCALGSALRLEERLTRLAGAVLGKLPLPKCQSFDMPRYITAVVLFCASGFGIYATFVEAMSGDSSIILSKAVLDAMTALIFAINLRWAMTVIPLPMIAVLLCMFGVGKLIAPVVSPEMLQDFTACGGLLTLAAGLRVADIKNTAITNMIPALVLVLPLSWLWSLLPF